MTADGPEVDGPAGAALRIVRGEPTAEELAVIAAVVTAIATAEVPADPARPPQGRWNDPAVAHRRAWRAGPGGWRAASG